MTPSILTRERFETIRKVLERRGPTTARDLERIHSILNWELEQAAAHGLLEFESRKPPTGRPACFVRVSENVSKSNPTKLLPSNWAVPVDLSSRHYRFVLSLAMATPKVSAYYEAGYRPKSYAAARAGASRLARRHQIQAALRYFQRTGRHFCRFPSDIATLGGTPWLVLLVRLPIDPSAELRCRLAASRDLAEARHLVASCLDESIRSQLGKVFHQYDNLMR
ncbi:hypothetical protein [Haloferula sp.]|uniref:hypothetical protein n=1 Tax=Haloferula sp. TaxID=2497595 RepID=UPI003C74551F